MRRRSQAGVNLVKSIVGASNSSSYDGVLELHEHSVSAAETDGASTAVGSVVHSRKNNRSMWWSL